MFLQRTADSERFEINYKTALPCLNLVAVLGVGEIFGTVIAHCSGVDPQSGNTLLRWPDLPTVESSSAGKPRHRGLRQTSATSDAWPDRDATGRHRRII
jgi:hypothetical protein